MVVTWWDVLDRSVQRDADSRMNPRVRSTQETKLMVELLSVVDLHFSLWMSAPTGVRSHHRVRSVSRPRRWAAPFGAWRADAGYRGLTYARPRASCRAARLEPKPLRRRRAVHNAVLRSSVHARRSGCHIACFSSAIAACRSGRSTPNVFSGPWCLVLGPFFEPGPSLGPGTKHDERRTARYVDSSRARDASRSR